MVFSFLFALWWTGRCIEGSVHIPDKRSVFFLYKRNTNITLSVILSFFSLHSVESTYQSECME